MSSSLPDLFCVQTDPKVRPNLMLSSILHSMALGILLDKCLLAFVSVARTHVTHDEQAT